MPIRSNEKYTPSMCEKIVEVMRAGGSKIQAAAAIGISRSMLYKWTNKTSEYFNPEMTAALELGLTLSQSHWEALGHSACMGEINNFASTAWIFTMKNRFRKDYKEKQPVQSGEETEPIRVVIEHLGRQAIENAASTGGKG